MRFRELNWDWRRERFSARPGKRRSVSGREGNRSQYLYSPDTKKCVGHAIQFSDDEWGFVTFGELGKDDIAAPLTKLELAAIIAPLVEHVDPNNPLVFERTGS